MVFKKSAFIVIPMVLALAGTGCWTLSGTQNQINALQKTIDQLITQLNQSNSLNATLASQIANLQSQLNDSNVDKAAIQDQLDFLLLTVEYVKTLGDEAAITLGVTKAFSLIGNYIVFQDDGGIFYAVDPSDWVPGTSAFDYYFDGYAILTSSGLTRSLYALTDNFDGTYNYFDGVNDYTFEETMGPSKDLERIGGKIENAKLARVASGLINQFGFSEERGLKAARMIQQWDTLKKSRAVTAADADAFSKEMMGFDFSKMREAVAQAESGNLNSLNALIKQAADANGTTPEAMNELMQLLAQ